MNAGQGATAGSARLHINLHTAGVCEQFPLRNYPSDDNNKERRDQQIFTWHRRSDILRTNRSYEKNMSLINVSCMSANHKMCLPYPLDHMASVLHASPAT